MHRHCENSDGSAYAETNSAKRDGANRPIVILRCATAVGRNLDVHETRGAAFETPRGAQDADGTLVPATKDGTPISSRAAFSRQRRHAPTKREIRRN